MSFNKVNKKSKHLIFGILIFAILFNVTAFSDLIKYSSTEEEHPEKTFKKYNPKFSGLQINITSPENKTYTEPMSGYYPATYGFENETDGTSGTDIDFVDDYHVHPPNTWAKIVTEFNGHKKVLECYDHNTDDVAWWHNHSAQTFGTYEFHMATSDPTYASVIYIYNNILTRTSLFGFRIDLDKFRCTNSGWIDVPGAPTPVANTWYHIRIDFECTGGTYMELAQYTYQVWINNVKYGPFSFDSDESQADEIGFVTSNTDTPYETYLDAFGFSWDADYTTGDNLKEGLLLSYDIGFTPDWRGYSLDGQANHTILGNTTILMPNDGIHSIQVFGNNSLGQIYQSEVRYFTVDTTNITIPEITINSPTDSEIFGTAPPNYDLSILGDYETIWYTIDDGVTYIIVSSLTGNIDQVEWDKKGNTIVTIKFFANNSAGSVGSAEVQIIKYVAGQGPPVIIINSPAQSDLFGKVAPNFSLSIIEATLDSTWYSLDGGAANITFIGTTGTISQSEWDKIGNGTVTISFYATNLEGYTGLSEVVVRKDIIDPIITINSPNTGQELEYPPVFDITINVPNLDSTWYTLDGGTTNVTFTGYDGIINEVVWNSTTNGPVTIDFYARDDVGNIGTDYVIIVKNTQQPESLPEIPGYNLIAIIGIVIIITTIIATKKRLINLS